jgi:hypothetical protein
MNKLMVCLCVCHCSQHLHGVIKEMIGGVTHKLLFCICYVNDWFITLLHGPGSWMTSLITSTQSMRSPSSVWSWKEMAILPSLMLASTRSHSMPYHYRKVQFSIQLSRILMKVGELVDSIENNILAKFQHLVSCSCCGAGWENSFFSPCSLY